MAGPTWIREDVVLAIHRRQLAEHGGAEGVRDVGLLQGGHAPDLAALAAAYASGIVRNHPFVDGNKRTAYVVCRAFLILNGHDIDAPRNEKLTTFLRLGDGSLSEDDLAGWLRRSLVPR